MQDINEIEELVKLISKLPGLGPRSSRRIILKMINNREEILKPTANALAKVFKNISRCQCCGTLKSNIEGCNNCENIKQKFNKICVVETISDQWTIENSNIYKGYFHILGGTISSLNQRKEDLLINSLVERVKRENIEEVIIGCSASLEGQTTAYYIKDSLKKTNTKITRLARGIPIGQDVENLDDGTLVAAFKNRNVIENNSS